MCTKKARTDPVWGILLILFFINFSFFITIWGIGVSQPGNHNFVRTLSYMLAHSDELKTLYIIWWSVYFVTNMYILYVVLYYNLQEVKNNDSDENKKWSVCNKFHNCSVKNKNRLFAIGTALYVPFLFIKLEGLLFLWLFDIDEDGSSHYVFTAAAIGASIIVSLALLLRRLTIRTYICIHPSVLWVIIINILFIIAAVTLSIIFIVIGTGAIEFALAILIGVDPIFQIIDYTWNLECEHTLEQWEGNEGNKKYTAKKITPVINDEIPVLQQNHKKTDGFVEPSFTLIANDTMVYHRRGVVS